MLSNIILILDQYLINQHSLRIHIQIKMDKCTYDYTPFNKYDLRFACENVNIRYELRYFLNSTQYIHFTNYDVRRTLVTLYS